MEVKVTIWVDLDYLTESQQETFYKPKNINEFLDLIKECITDAYITPAEKEQRADRT